MFTMQRYTFIKTDIPLEQKGKTELARKLLRYNVSLQVYTQALKQEEIQ